jgi:molybdopterin-guanine dinucleotide biosynthesis protein B
MRTLTVALVGHSGSGKTTALLRLVPVLVARGLRVGLLKHTHHTCPSDPERPGSDSELLRQSGAPAVALVGAGWSWGFTPKGNVFLGGGLETAQVWLEDFGVDIILLEGGKTSRLPKLQVFRTGLSVAPLPLEGLLAMISDMVVPDVLCLPMDRPDLWADLLMGMPRMK